MKEAIVTAADNVEIVDSPVPEPYTPDHVVIKVIVSGSNPKDWKVPLWQKKPQNSGDDIAGIVHSVGANVYEFKPGDRVAAFHEMRTKGGSFAEYAVSFQHTTFHIPESVSFEEAATIPLAAMTSAVGLYVRMGLPEPWKVTAEKKQTPIVVYGAASAVGAFAIQLASLSGLHPIIGVAGRGIPFAESLIDKEKGDAIVDYRDGDESVVSGIRAALKKAGVSSEKVAYAFDGVSEHGSIENIIEVLSPDGGNVTSVLPPQSFARTKDWKAPAGVNSTHTLVGCVHEDQKDFGFVFFRYFAHLLAEKRFKGHPYEVIPGGLDGVTKGLQNLQGGKASATKYVFKIADTEGAGKE